MDDIKEEIVRLTRLSKEDKNSLPQLARAYANFGLLREAGRAWLDYAEFCIEKKDEDGFFSSLEEFLKLGIESLDLRFYFAKILLMRNKRDKAREEFRFLASEFSKRGEEKRMKEAEEYLKNLERGL